MVFLAKFLHRNLKGYRFLIILAILVTFAQVGSDLLAAMPLKFIPSKVNNPGSDPVCTFPFLDPVLSVFDTPLLDPSLRPTQPNQPPNQPPPAPCPATSTNPNVVVHPRITQHSTIGVIVFSLIMLSVFGLLSALLVYIEFFLVIFNALAVIRAYTLEKRENKRFGHHVGTYRAAGMRAGRLQAQFTPLVAVLVVFGTIIVVGIGGFVAAGNGFSFGFINIGASTIDVG